MIQFTCPACGKQMKVSDEAAGKHGKCNQCGERVVVPAANRQSPPSDAPPLRRPPSRRSTPLPFESAPSPAPVRQHAATPAAVIPHPSPETGNVPQGPEAGDRSPERDAHTTAPLDVEQQTTAKRMDPLLAVVGGVVAGCMVGLVIALIGYAMLFVPPIGLVVGLFLMLLALTVPVALPVILFRYSTGFADTPQDIRAESAAPNEMVLYHAHPKMFKNSPIRFLVWVALAPLGVGLIVLLFWWLKVLGTTLTVTNERIVLRKGVLAKHTNEVYHSDVRNVQVSQSFLQRISGVGAIGVASAGSAGLEIMVVGIPAPQKVKGIIDQERRRSR